MRVCEVAGFGGPEVLRLSERPWPAPAAGEVVVRIGADVAGYAAGDPVVGMIPWVRIGGRVGAYAQAAAVDPDWLALRPDELDEITGTTVPLNALTARQALDLISAPAGATLLVTGATGAVGGFAVQLAARDGLQGKLVLTTG